VTVTSVSKVGPPVLVVTARVHDAMRRLDDVEDALLDEHLRPRRPEGHPPGAADAQVGISLDHPVWLRPVPPHAGVGAHPLLERDVRRRIDQPLLSDLVPGHGAGSARSARSAR
jgi:hypothetical protein